MLIYYYCVSAWPGPASSQRHGDDQTLPGQDAAGLLTPQEAGKPPVCHLHHLLLRKGNAGLSTLSFLSFYFILFYFLFKFKFKDFIVHKTLH